MRSRYYAVVFLFCIPVVIALGEDLPVDLQSRFKAFISNPPIIKGVSFQYSEGGSTNREYYSAKWQKDAFFLRRFRPFESIEHAAEEPVVHAFGYFENHYWRYTEDNGLSLYSRNHQGALGESTNGIYQACMNRLDFFSWLMNLGVPNSPVGSISWRGDEFSVTNLSGWVWKGKIEYNPTNNGIIGLSLVVTVRSGDSYQHKVRYEFENPRSTSCGIPTAFYNSTLFKGVWVDAGHFRIEKLETSKSRLSRDAFAFETLKFENPRTWVSSNNVLYVLVKDPSVKDQKTRLAQVRYVLPGSSDDPASRYPRWVRSVIAGLMVFITVMFGFFVFRKRVRGHK